MLGVVDTKVCKAPVAYNGSREKWRHFRVSLCGYISALSPELVEMMKYLWARVCSGDAWFQAKDPLCVPSIPVPAGRPKVQIIGG